MKQVGMCVGIMMMVGVLASPAWSYDFDADGVDDVFWRNTQDGSTAVWLIRGGRIHSSGFPGGVALAWQVAQFGDFDGDGKDDVMWRNEETGVVAVWYMDGSKVRVANFPGSASQSFQIQPQ